MPGTGAGTAAVTPTSVVALYKASGNAGGVTADTLYTSFDVRPSVRFANNGLYEIRFGGASYTYQTAWAGVWVRRTTLASQALAYCQAYGPPYVANIAAAFSSSAVVKNTTGADITTQLSMSRGVIDGSGHSVYIEAVAGMPLYCYVDYLGRADDPRLATLAAAALSMTT
jgi:hypothetical protein